MVVASKRYRKASERVDRAKLYTVRDAVGLLKTLPPAKFDETVEIAIHLGIDPKKSDQLVRGAVSLPKGLGKSVRVVVFAEGGRADEAKAAGADVVGSEDLAKRIADGWTEFDVVIAAPDMMKHVGKLGKVLGPQGKMPSPKSGTVTPDLVKAVTEFRAGKIEFRADAYGNVHAPVGKLSFDAAALQENVTALVDMILHMKPAASKGKYINKVAISTTMGPSLILDITG